MIGDLDREIANEEKRAGIGDPAHFAYPTYARAAMGRRDNLKFDRQLSARSRTPRRRKRRPRLDFLKFETLEVRDKSSDRLTEAVARA